VAETRVLIVDDDPDLRAFLSTELRAEGHHCDLAATGQEALLLLRREPPDLVLLDWTLPDFSGVEVCQRMRASQVITPVLMLTARDDVSERVKALDAGADDYLTKPFSIEELLARVRAQLRRVGLHNNQAGERLELADLVVDTASHEVSRAGTAISLTVREYDLLTFLLRRPNQVHSRQDILDAVWGESFVGDPSLLDVYVRYLRRKLEPMGQPSLLQTVRGVGFMLKEGPLRE
jgi:two-component system response regulator MprA